MPQLTSLIRPPSPFSIVPQTILLHFFPLFSLKLLPPPCFAATAAASVASLLIFFFFQPIFWLTKLSQLSQPMINRDNFLVYNNQPPQSFPHLTTTKMWIPSQIEIIEIKNNYSVTKNIDIRPTSLECNVKTNTGLKKGEIFFTKRHLSTLRFPLDPTF